MEEYKYTCEPGHQEWTPLNSNLCMQSIKVTVVVLLTAHSSASNNICISTKYAMSIAVFDFIKYKHIRLWRIGPFLKRQSTTLAGGSFSFLFIKDSSYSTLSKTLVFILSLNKLYGTHLSLLSLSKPPRSTLSKPPWSTSSSTEDTLLLLDLVRQKKQAENEQKKVRESETRQTGFQFVEEGRGEVRTILYRKLESGRWLCSRSRRRRQREEFRFLSV